MLNRFCLALCIVTLPLVASQVRAADESFFISYWVGPAPSDEAFAQVAAANFTVAMTGGGKPALDLAEKHGLKAIIQDGRITAKGFRDPEFAKGLDAVVADYASHPALWGYYITDEPNAAQFENLAAINQRLIGKDPKHVPFINLFPTYADAGQLGNPTYEKHVSSFLEIVRPRLLSYDHYALFKDGIRHDYFENLEIVRRQGLEHKTPFNYILLAVPHFGYRNPTEEDLRWQVNTALAYGARGIMYFTYSSLPRTKDFEGWGEAIIGHDGKPTAKYEQVTRINGEIKALAPTLLSLTSTAVYHTVPLPSGAKAIPPGDLVAGITGGQFVVGHFRSKTGERYVMFVNRDPRTAAEAAIQFAGDVSIEELEAAPGAISLEKQGDKRLWRVHFAPGQRRLVKVR